MSANATAAAPVQFSESLLQQIRELRGRYEDHRAAILPVLHIVQREHGWISPEVAKATAKAMDMPLSKVHECVTFYALVRTKPEGECRVAVCQTMTCMLRGARELFRHMREKYGVSPGETTSDGRVTLHAVECLGNCEDGPVAHIGDDYHGPLTCERLDQIITERGG
jgi:NADH-quinone oxidoreductase E subunit